MKTCQDCQKPIPYGTTFGGGVCAHCRGKRAAKVVQAKRDKHGPAYFARKDRRSNDARGSSL